jgi:hypothetical protein
MSYSLKTVFGIPGVQCEKTSRLLSERSLKHHVSENLDEDSEGGGDGGGDSDSGGSDSEGGDVGEGAVRHVSESESRRSKIINRDDVKLLEWRRLAGIE